MAKDNPHNHEEDQIEAIQEKLNSAELFVQNNKKYILIGVIGLFAVAMLFLFTNKSAEEQSEEAAAALFRSEQLFAIDSFQQALGGEYEGFLMVADKYGSSTEGNLAKAYAGLSYFFIGQKDAENGNADAAKESYQKAAEFLEDFDEDDLLVSPSIKISAGDAFMNVEDYNKAARLYRSAQKPKNSLTTPRAMKKLGIAYLALGKKGDAEEAFIELQEKYPYSVDAADAVKYMAKVKSLK